MQTVCVLSENDLFAEGIRLELSAYSVAVSRWCGRGDLPVAETYLWDMDSLFVLPEIKGRLIYCAWQQERPEGFSGIWLDRPFRPARLRAVLGLYDPYQVPSAPYPDHSQQSVLLAGESIQLTPLEFRLFCCLFEAKGEYLSREALHQAVWKGEGDRGIVNVYIHYLRQKLEKQGQKYFHSARGRGYAYFENGGKD